MRFPLTAFLILQFAAVSTLCGQDEPADPDAPVLDAEGPAQLIERGQAAFAASDFAAAEVAIEKFIRDYSEAEEAKEAVRVFTPMLAISKVGVQKFGEALEWIDKSLTDPQIEFRLRDELSFWRGVCLMTQGDLVEAQHAFGEYWAEEKHQPFKRYEALLMFATLYLQQDFPAEAADFLESQLPKFRDVAPEAASRAIVLQLYSRVKAGQRDKALELIRAEYPHLDEMTQVISFQSIALQLGAEFLNEKDWYRAITCLQRIWPKEKLLEHQNAKLKGISERIEVVRTRPDAQSIVFQLNAIQKRVKRELENFEKMENFDSALRLRLAMAFQGLERYREAALIMEDMLETMDPDPVVESASLAALQCWMEVGRWPRAIAAAERYEKVFGAEGKSLATVLFLKAEALRENRDYGSAQLAYGKVVEKFADHAFAPKALFMQGFLYLQQDDNEGALFQFDQVQRKYPKSGMVEDADYWTGMAYSFSKEYEAAREHLGEYLKRYDSPKYKKEAIFRIAVCTFSLAEYVEAIDLLEAFVKSYPGDELCDEAHLLLGDAWLGEGDIEKGFAAYEAVRPTAQRFFEEAWFKKGKAYKLLEEFDRMREHYQEFVDTYPGSNRMPEAIYWVGWTYLNEDESENAKQIYWDVIEKYGDDPDRHTLADVFSALPKVYKQDGDAGREELLTRLERMKAGAENEGRHTLALRSAWTKSQIIGKTSPSVAKAELLAAANAGWINPKEQNPMLTVEVAEALLEAENLLTAKEMLLEIRKWHPRAVQKDRIFAALGMIAAEQGEPELAIDYYERFEREAATSTRLGEVQIQKARLLADQGKAVEARATLESVLENQTVPAAQKAETIFELGQSYLSGGDAKKAIVYFERVYIAYGKFGELNAKAYWERGNALEKLDLKREALETYSELVSRDDLRRFEEAKKAGEKVARLEKLVPPLEPAEVIPEGEGAEL